jgi:hypothetical protein
VLEENHEDSLTITEHPVEQGASISDHAFKKPESVTIRGGVSDSTPGAGAYAARTFYEALLELQKKREPFDLVTGKRLYKNMLLESLSVVTTMDTEHSLMFTAVCREVIIVQARVATIPPRQSHARKDTGAVTDKGPQQPVRRQSVLKAGLG